MLFNTVEFVIFFIIILSIFVILKNRYFHHIFLLGASYLFFYLSSNYLITLLIFTSIWVFYFGKIIHHTTDKKTKKILLAISLAGNLGLLGFFKYSDFVITEFNFLGQYLDLGTEIPLLNIALPIAISFYTFQSMSYIIDIYRGNLIPSKTLKEYAFFVAFFPPLVAGPILRASNFLPQLREKLDKSSVSQKLKLFVIQRHNLKFGITLMSLGFFKKMFFADNIGPLVNNIFSNPIGMESFSIILGAIAFGVQIYCDFSGYSDIAIGAAAILGLKIPLNFNKPFFATSPSDFWSRWHISLSTWVRDYLYYPLVFKNRKSSGIVFISLLISMAIMGIWHGASWNFLIWGGIHGIFLGCYTLVRIKFPNLSSNNFFSTRFGKVISIIVTQYIVFFTFIVFWIKDFDHMIYAMKKYVFLDFATHNTLEIIKSNEFAVLLLTLFGILHFISYKKGNIPEKISKLHTTYWTILITLLFLAIALFYVGTPQEFIYFEF